LGKLRKRTILSVWLGRLPAEKAAVYEPSVRELETGYSLISFALDEGLRRSEAGELRVAREAAQLCGALAERHAEVLCGALRTLERRSRHFGTLPEVQPLDAETFRGEAARTASKWNALLHRVLFSARARWFHKLRTLEEIVWFTQETFLETAGELAEGVTLAPRRAWAQLEESHDDWNTCLQETTILLKCLLEALAPGEVEELRGELEKQRQRAEKESSEWVERRKRKVKTLRREGSAQA
jgi:hypothetical protein